MSTSEIEVDIHLSVKRRKGFTHIPNTLISDTNLSGEARMVLILILSMDDGWIFRVSNLCRDLKFGRDRFYRFLKELQDNNYLKIERRRNGKGAFDGTKWSAVDDPKLLNVDNPRTDSQDEDHPRPEYPDTDNPHSDSATHKNKNKEEQKEISCVSASPSHTQDDLFLKFWKMHPRPRDEARSRKMWDVAIRDENPAKILAAVKIYADEQKGNRKQYITFSDNWLELRRWKDYDKSAQKLIDRPFTPNPVTIEQIKRGNRDGAKYLNPTTAMKYVECGALTKQQLQTVGIAI